MRGSGSKIALINKYSVWTVIVPALLLPQQLRPLQNDRSWTTFRCLLQSVFRDLYKKACLHYLLIIFPEIYLEIFACVSLRTGASTLDPEMCGRYKLSVMVKDMAGKANAFFNTGLVTVEVTGNTWASPDPVRLQENLPGPYPIPISQVSLFVPACIQS